MLPPLNCICHYKLRRDIKADHGIDQGGCIRDALIVNFCFCCALIQVITFVFLACLGQACCRLAEIFDLGVDREIVTPLLQMKKNTIISGNEAAATRINQKFSIKAKKSSVCFDRGC